MRLALGTGQALEGGEQQPGALVAIGRSLPREDHLDRGVVARAPVVHGHVVREAGQPGEERHRPLVVLDDRGHQLGEDELGHVLGLVVVARQGADVALDVARVAFVEEAQRVAIARLRPAHGDRYDAPCTHRLDRRERAAAPILAPRVALQSLGHHAGALTGHAVARAEADVDDDGPGKRSDTGFIRWRHTVHRKSAPVRRTYSAGCSNGENFA